MERVYNFSAGPSVLPVPVLEKAQKELVCYGKSGMSVMEMSHRSKAFVEIYDNTEARLRKLMAVPDNYHILFLTGGATMQFSMVPQNLAVNKKADYLDTGEFASKSISEAKKLVDINVVASSADKKYSYIPKVDPSKCDKNADYFHVTSNNTIYGTRHTSYPDTGAVPLVVDMSSNILSEVYDVSKFGLIYAGAQKNMAPAGVTIVIIRDDLLSRSDDALPVMLSYKVQAKDKSMHNTPPCYPIYMAGLVCEWLLDLGGVAAMQKINEAKAGVLYDYIDASKMFSNPVVKADRSIMNVPFVTGDAALDDKFVKEAEAAGFVNLKGHRSVGGMRASIYNAMPAEGVSALVEFMKGFESRN